VDCIPPSDFQDEKIRVGLVGKLLNATDEISSASAITSELFKKIVTCNWTKGRDLYKSVVKFKPQALHVMNANGLPPLKGGLGPADKRRFRVIPFNRRIPKEERIRHLGERIVHEETDLVLAWAVDGLLRVARNGWLFTELAASTDLIEEWQENLCPVTGWLMSGEVVFETPVVDGREQPVPKKEAYRWFKTWARGEDLRGDQPMGPNTFTTRMKATDLGPIWKHTNKGAVFLNLRQAHSDVIVLEQRANVIKLHEDHKAGA